MSRTCTSPAGSLDTPTEAPARGLELIATRHAGPVEQAEPLPIAEAGAAFRQAIDEAARFALDNRDSLAVVDGAAGAGKTREALAVAAQLTAEGARVVFALPTVDGAAEKARELAALIAEGVAVAAPVELAAGALREGPDGCRVWNEAPDPTRRRFERIYAAGGRRAICKDCPHFGLCPAAERPRARPGVVTFAAHAGADRMAEISDGGERSKDDPPPPLVLFYDESPDLVTAAEVERAHLATLIEAPAGAKWRKSSPPAVAAARALIRALDTMASEEAAARARRVVEYDPLRPLVDLLEARPGCGGPYLDPDGEGWGPGAMKAPFPPVPPPDVARRDGGARWPDIRAWRVVLALLEHDPLALVRFTADGWVVELRRTWTPPDPLEGAGGPPAVVVLDATPNRIALEAVARNAGRTVRAWTVPVVGVGPRLALHLDSERFANGRIRRREGVLLTAAQYAFGMINRALPAGWEARAAEGRPVVVGILTHKVLAEALRGKGRGAEAKAAAELATEATRAGIRLEIGHFGADGVASNRFARVDVLAVVGDPRAHLDGARFDARALGLNDAGARAYLAAKNAGAAVQALARARWSRPDREGGPPALIWCGRTPPPVPGGWTVVRGSQGSRDLADLARPGALPLDTLARELADRWHAIGTAALIAEAKARGVELGRKPAEALAIAEGRARGWPTFRVGSGGRGRPVTVYAADRAAAEALAAWVRSGGELAGADNHNKAPAGTPVDALALAREVAETHGAVCAAAVVALGAERGISVGSWAAWKASKVAAAERRWPPFTHLPAGRKGGRAPVVYGADLASVNALWALTFPRGEPPQVAPPAVSPPNATAPAVAPSPAPGVVEVPTAPARPARGRRGACRTELEDLETFTARRVRALAREGRDDFNDKAERDRWARRWALAEWLTLAGMPPRAELARQAAERFNMLALPLYRAVSLEHAERLGVVAEVEDHARSEDRKMLRDAMAAEAKRLAWSGRVVEGCTIWAPTQDAALAIARQWRERDADR